MMLDRDAVCVAAEYVDIVAAVYCTEGVALSVIGCAKLVAVILVADAGASEGCEDYNYTNEDDE